MQNAQFVIENDVFIADFNVINEKLPGINIQQPWAQLLLSDEMIIETIKYQSTY